MCVRGRQGALKMSLFRPAGAGRLTLPLLAVAAAVLGACASHPKPTPSIARPTAPPMAQAPAYSAPPPEAVQGVPLPGSARDFVGNVGDRVYFGLDQFTIRADAQPILANQAAWLQRYPEVHV